MRQRNKASATVTAARVIGVTALVAGSAFAMTQANAAAPAETGAKAGAKAGKASEAAAVKADFNGDGYADTVTSAPTGTVNGKENAGYITVTYGSAKGTSTTNKQVISADSPEVPDGDPEAVRFGSDSVARDFDGDGVTDLAVMASGRTVILWGEKGKGLTKGTEVAGVGSGKLAAGDFNGDGKADLAVSGDRDEVKLAYGPFTRDGKPAKTGTVKPGHTFGPEKLIAGDVTGDGIDDLVTTHAFEEMSENSEFFKGSKDGLVNKPQKTDDAAEGVIADVDGDGYEDLVVRTVPGGVVEDLPYDHGTVKVLYGTADGPSSKRTTTLTQNSPGVPGVNEEGDEFGAALAAGDVNGDGYADITVGVPGEDIGSGASGKDTGAVVQLFGGKDGLSGKGAKNYDQGTEGVPGAVEAGDHFGGAVSLQDTDGDGHDDVVIGAPGEDGAGAGAVDAGAVWVLRGSAQGVTTQGVVSYGPKTLGAPESGAQLGSSFAR